MLEHPTPVHISICISEALERAEERRLEDGFPRFPFAVSVAIKEGIARAVAEFREENPEMFK